MLIKILDKASLGEDTPLEVLSSLGEVVFYNSTSQNEIKERIADAEVIIINKVRITAEVIASAPRLRLICVFATGYDNIDLAAAKLAGVAVCNVPGYSTDSVALFILSTVLALCSHLFEYDRFVKSGRYLAEGLPNRLVPVYHEIKGKTWGIIGYGNIGKAVARIADAMGAKVIVYTRTPTDERCNVDIDTLCREADIITLHCPLNEGTAGLINAQKIALMKSGVIIVNEARGAVLNEADVADALLKGRIGGFGSDVYSKEPFEKEHPYNAIMNLPNVILTPHAAWGSYESRERCIGVIANNIRAFIKGETLNRVDK